MFCQQCGAPLPPAPPGAQTMTPAAVRQPPGMPSGSAAAEGQGRSALPSNAASGKPSTPEAPAWPRTEPARCRACGHALRHQARFCRDCGTPVSDPGLPAQPVPTEQTPSTATRRGRTWLVGATSTVAIAALAAITVFAVLPQFRGGTSTAQAGQPTVGDPPGEGVATAPSPPTEGAFPEPQTPLPADPAAALRLLAAEGAQALAAVPDGTWVPQVSAKCTPLTTVDQRDASGRVGWPDGTRESFPSGLTEQDVLDFHSGLAGRLSLDTTDLILVTPDDLGMTDRSASLCGSETLWISLVASEQHSTQAGALAYCSDSGLPQGECAARSIGPDTEFVLPAGDAPRPGDPDTYPVTTSTSLSVRTSPAVDAPVLGYVPAGGYVTIECAVYGDPVEDPAGKATPLWDRISRPFEGYVSHAFIDTGGRGVSAC